MKTILTNQDIIAMVGAGLSPAIIKASITKSKTNFNLSAPSLVQLKKSGMPDDILLAMIGKSAVKPEPTKPIPKDSLEFMQPGIYLKQAENYTEMSPSELIASNAAVALGTVKKLVGNIINFPVKASIQSAHAATLLNQPRPQFLFVLDFPAKSPGEFFLVRMQVLKGERQISFLRPANTAPIQVADTMKIAFSSKKIKEGVYEVLPMHGLAPGEYCFIYNSSTLYQGREFKAFDFSIGHEASPPKKSNRADSLMVTNRP